MTWQSKAYTCYIHTHARAQVQGTKVDLLICCGDFQCMRSTQDYGGLACPDKYKTLVRDREKDGDECVVGTHFPRALLEPNAR